MFPCVPVRQWVISVPKRLRYFLLRDPELASRALRIILRIIEQTLRECSPGAPLGARTGAVSYLHRFGSALNAHLHYHCCLIDGVFAETDQGLQFFEASALTDEVLERVQETIRKRLLRLFVRKGLLDKEAAEQMRQWSHGGGFSLDAKVRIGPFDRQALERLLRYCARPLFASERLVWLEEGERLSYRLPKPRPDGQTTITLTALEFLDLIALLIPPPKRHRLRYFGVLAPNASLRQAVTARAGLPIDADSPTVSTTSETQPPLEPEHTPPPPPSSSLWAMLLARIYECFPLLCPHCGAEMRIIAFVTEPASIQRILNHIGEPITPPQIPCARAPPLETPIDQDPDYDPTAPEPSPDYEFDQRINW